MRRAGWLLPMLSVMTLGAVASASADAAFEVEQFEIYAVGATEPGEAVRAGVSELLDKYLQAAIVEPLRSSESAGDLSAVFGSATAERVGVGGQDRAALVDEGLPRASDVTVEMADASVSVLVGPDGEVALVWAGIHVKVTGKVGRSPVAVERTGELLLGLEDSTWKINAYEIKVTRDTADETTTTQAP